MNTWEQAKNALLNFNFVKDYNDPSLIPPSQIAIQQTIQLLQMLEIQHKDWTVNLITLEPGGGFLIEFSDNNFIVEYEIMNSGQIEKYVYKNNTIVFNQKSNTRI